MTRRNYSVLRVVQRILNSITNAPFSLFIVHSRSYSVGYQRIEFRVQSLFQIMQQILACFSLLHDVFQRGFMLRSLFLSCFLESIIYSTASRVLHDSRVGRSLLRTYRCIFLNVAKYRQLDAEMWKENQGLKWYLNCRSNDTDIISSSKKKSQGLQETVKKT